MLYLTVSRGRCFCETRSQHDKRRQKAEGVERQRLHIPQTDRRQAVGNAPKARRQQQHENLPCADVPLVFLSLLKISLLSFVKRGALRRPFDQLILSCLLGFRKWHEKRKCKNIDAHALLFLFTKTAERGGKTHLSPLRVKSSAPAAKSRAWRSPLCRPTRRRRHTARTGHALSS